MIRATSEVNNRDEGKELQGFEATLNVLGKRLKESWVEATSLGLKTKLGLGPNC